MRKMKTGTFRPEKSLYVLQIKIEIFREGSSDPLLSVDVKTLLKPRNKYRGKRSLFFGSLDSKDLPDFFHYCSSLFGKFNHISMREQKPM